MPGIPPWLMSLAARARPFSASSGSSARSRAEALGRRLERGLKIVEWLAIGPAPVDDHDQRVARLGVEARQKLRARAPEDGDRQMLSADCAGWYGRRRSERHRRRPRRASRREWRSPRPRPRPRSTSTTATGRPPIAATSLRLTITPHQPANHGIGVDEGADEALGRRTEDARRRRGSPRNRRRRESRPGRARAAPRRRRCPPSRRAPGWLSIAPRERRAPPHPCQAAFLKAT